MINQTYSEVNRQSVLSCSVYILVVLILLTLLSVGQFPMEPYVGGQLIILALGLSAIALAILKLSYREA